MFSNKERRKKQTPALYVSYPNSHLQSVLFRFQIDKTRIFESRRRISPWKLTRLNESALGRNSFHAFQLPRERSIFQLAKGARRNFAVLFTVDRNSTMAHCRGAKTQLPAPASAPPLDCFVSKTFFMAKERKRERERESVLQSTARFIFTSAATECRSSSDRESPEEALLLAQRARG